MSGSLLSLGVTQFCFVFFTRDLQNRDHCWRKWDSTWKAILKIVRMAADIMTSIKSICISSSFEQVYLCFFAIAIVFLLWLFSMHSLYNFLFIIFYNFLRIITRLFLWVKLNFIKVVNASKCIRFGNIKYVYL